MKAREKNNEAILIKKEKRKEAATVACLRDSQTNQETITISHSLI